MVCPGLFSLQTISQCPHEVFVFLPWFVSSFDVEGVSLDHFSSLLSILSSLSVSGGRLSVSYFCSSGWWSVVFILLVVVCGCCFSFMYVIVERSTLLYLVHGC